MNDLNLTLVVRPNKVLDSEVDGMGTVLVNDRSVFTGFDKSGQIGIGAVDVTLHQNIGHKFAFLVSLVFCVYINLSNT